MSEKGKKNANTLAIWITWLSVIGAAAGAILTQLTGLGVEVPTVVLSILSVLALLARRMPQVPVSNPRGSSLAIGLLVAVLSLAGVAPEGWTDAYPADPPAQTETLDVLEPSEDAREEVPLVMLPAVGARLFVEGVVGSLACNPVTPGIKTGGAYLTDNYRTYVTSDPALSDAQKLERHEIACNHRRLLGLSIPDDCPPVPGEE